MLFLLETRSINWRYKVRLPPNHAKGGRLLAALLSDENSIWPVEEILLPDYSHRSQIFSFQKKYEVRTVRKMEVVSGVIRKPIRCCCRRTNALELLGITIYTAKSAKPIARGQKNHNEVTWTVASKQTFRAMDQDFPCWPFCASSEEA